MSSSSNVAVAVIVLAVSSLVFYSMSEEEPVETHEDQRDDPLTPAVRTLCSAQRDDKEDLAAILNLFSNKNCTAHVKNDTRVILRESAIGCSCDAPNVTICVSDALLQYFSGMHSSLSSAMVLALLTENANAQQDYSKVDKAVSSLQQSVRDSLVRDLLELGTNVAQNLGRICEALLALVAHNPSFSHGLQAHHSLLTTALKVGLTIEDAHAVACVLHLLENVSKDQLVESKQVLEEIVRRGALSSEGFDYQTTYAAFFPVEEAQIAPHMIWLECAQLAQGLLAKTFPQGAA